MGFALALVGLAVNLIKSLLGAGTYATQLGTTSAFPAASLATPFVSWIGIGAGLVIFSWAHNGCSRRRALTYLGTLLVLQEAVGLLLAGSGGAFLVIGVPIVIGCLILRLVKLRYFVRCGRRLTAQLPHLHQARELVCGVGLSLLAVYSALVTWAISALLRRNDPWVFALVVTCGPLVIGTEASYPDNVVAVIQIAVSVPAAYLLLRGWYMLFG